MLLRPRDTTTRERRALNQAAAVRFDADGAGRRDGWFDGPLLDARALPVPASCSDLFADERVRDHVGDGLVPDHRPRACWARRAALVERL